MQRLLIDPADTIAVCPHCRRSYGVSTGTLEQVSATRLPDGRYRYLLEEAESHGGRRLRKVETVQSLGLQVGSLVTLVKRGPILIGIVDHGREVWFSIEPAPARLRGGRRFIDFMSAVILFCVALTAIGWAASLKGSVADRGSGALALFVAMVAAVAGAAIVVPRLQEHLASAEDDRDDDPGLPPLQLPDLE